MDELAQLFAALFTPSQQVALAIITLAVIALMQVFKNIYFGLCPKHTRGKRKAVLWLAAFILGVVCGVAGYFVGEPPQPLWFWMFVGAASGCVAIFVFKSLADVISPILKPLFAGMVRRWLS